MYFTVFTHNNIPTAAGLASSASGYAALVLALDRMFNLGLGLPSLSVLARMGSGSACRSLFDGFVLWNRGTRADGMDSYAEKIQAQWPGLCIGIVNITRNEKPIGSREAMNRTVASSQFYKQWPGRVKDDLAALQNAIRSKDFELLGRTSEANALAMHATMIETWPPVLFWQPETIAVFQKVWELRNKRVAVYFTIDAGPNVKLLFQTKDSDMIENEFTDFQTVKPFG